MWLQIPFNRHGLIQFFDTAGMGEETSLPDALVSRSIPFTSCPVFPVDKAHAVLFSFHSFPLDLDVSVLRVPNRRRFASSELHYVFQTPAVAGLLNSQWLELYHVARVLVATEQTLRNARLSEKPTHMPVVPPYTVAKTPVLSPPSVQSHKSDREVSDLGREYLS